MSLGVNVWIALDVDTVEQAEHFFDLFPGHRHYKVGMQLFYRIGINPIKRWIQEGYQIFLDLKLYDIPNTVGQAVRALDDLGVVLLTVHIMGGPAMLEQVRAHALHAQVVGVTVVTSLSDSDLQMIGIDQSVEETVIRYGRVARDAGLDGLVTSGSEIEPLRQLWPEARLVVPGIRFGDGDKNDQKRVITPEQALKQGATDLVVGRALTGSQDPAATYRWLMDIEKTGGE